jgi:hypothetical protein
MKPGLEDDFSGSYGRRMRETKRAGALGPFGVCAHHTLPSSLAAFRELLGNFAFHGVQLILQG